MRENCYSCSGRQSNEPGNAPDNGDFADPVRGAENEIENELRHPGLDERLGRRILKLLEIKNLHVKLEEEDKQIIKGLD
ncbi:MAG: hypothetical protein WBD37_01680, partial [Anderseniella sp.]